MADLYIRGRRNGIMNDRKKIICSIRSCSLATTANDEFSQRGQRFSDEDIDLACQPTIGGDCIRLMSQEAILDDLEK